MRIYFLRSLRHLFFSLAAVQMNMAAAASLGYSLRQVEEGEFVQFMAGINRTEHPLSLCIVATNNIL